jgi:hypothetical protein
MIMHLLYFGELFLVISGLIKGRKQVASET